MCDVYQQVNDMWNVYDRGRDGVLSRQEVREMIEDISFVKKGHRNVPEENFEEVSHFVANIVTVCSKYREMCIGTQG